MKKVDFSNPHRQKHFEFFMEMARPHFSVCVNVDITKFRSFLKQQEFSFTPSIVYLISRTANEIQEFRYRIRGRQVVEHESVHPSFTVLTEVAKVFSFCHVTYQPEMSSFIVAARQQMELMKKNPIVEDEERRDDWLFLSSFPWASFTGIQHPMQSPAQDSVPRIVWGKYFEEAGKIKMPLSVQAHHAVVDGRDIGRYFERIQELLDEPGRLI